MALVLGESPHETAEALWEALRAGLVVPLGEAHDLVAEGLEDASGIAYQFLHDRVQQACYSTIPPEDVPALHLRVGQLLLDRLRRSGEEEGLFEVLAHLNAGIEVVSEGERRRELAQLNLDAARKAKTSNAYESAAAYAPPPTTCARSSMPGRTATSCSRLMPTSSWPACTGSAGIASPSPTSRRPGPFTSNAERGGRHSCSRRKFRSC